MADSSRASKPPTSRSSTALTPAGVDNPTTVRSRNRRAPQANHASGSSPSPSRGVSPMPSARLSSTKLQSGGLSSPLNGTFSRGLLEGSWAPNWSTVQDFATSLLEGGYSSEPSRPNSRSGPKSQPKSFWKGFGGMNALAGNASETWGPTPPSNSRPAPRDIAAGSLAEREAQLMARKKASVLESHDGANGGLDVTGKYKRRNSDENIRSVSQPVIEEFLVYLHHVQPTDTYAGIILRYRCMEHALRKINGLWSRDNIQVRKHLLIPIDACETKGRPCDPPSHPSQKVDHLAMTPQNSDVSAYSRSNVHLHQPLHDDYFGSLDGKTTTENAAQDADERPWTHVRWVKLDSLQEPVEIVRVKRTAVGYFPPRRKKSVQTVSTLSTPRQSLELAKVVSNNSVVANSPGRISSRRQSAMSARPTASSLSLGSPASGRSRGNSVGQTEGLPSWMRKPGGVGSMEKSVKAPGPASDSFNAWVKRVPGFNMDTLPSMSVMGSETAQFGFFRPAEEGSGIAESPFEEGRDAAVPPKNGMGLEHAASSIETWIRGAWAKRPATPILGSLRKPVDDLDLIELADTASDDGRTINALGRPSQGFLDHTSHGSTSRSDGEGASSMRGRPTGPGGGEKGKKSD
ncbi:hypothetical protein SAMD00023353_4600070 [Rosellinia necatrix]|uniref:LysM domain-containing protein n=1 Tax=Rosellinia necatrix TaxID=77044 RepID=A0A1W2TPE5_ROSNE|nr:hypothetical protein SAMD00023353_4600070 [Rosellinia necatrix]